MHCCFPASSRFRIEHVQTISVCYILPPPKEIDCLSQFVVWGNLRISSFFVAYSIFGIDFQCCLAVMEFLFLALSRESLRIRMRVRAEVGNRRLTMVMEGNFCIPCFESCIIGEMSVVLYFFGFISWRRIASSILYLIACEKELHISQRYNNRCKNVKQDIITVFF